MEFNSSLLWVTCGVLGCLAVGSCIRLYAVRKSSESIARQRLSSLRVWWGLAILLFLLAPFGLPGATLLIATASALGLVEYLRLLGPRVSIGKSCIACFLLCGVFQFGSILNGEGDLAKWIFPVGSLLLFGAVRAVAGNTQDYIRITAAIYWGGMLMIYAISHSLFLFDLQPGHQPSAGSSGWFLYLVLLTEINDIVQAIVGRKFGATRITPAVSPNKSLEGLAGGFLATVVMAIILSPSLTTFGTTASGTTHYTLLSAGAGGLISISGFLGDINMSAIKRDAGVKDGSSLFPGMGGMIDRIDSLVFTAPAFYYFVVFVEASAVAG